MSIQHGQINDFQLADADLVAGHVEVLVVTENQLIGGSTVNSGLDLEHFHAQSHDVINTSDLGQSFNSSFVLIGAGDRLEHNGVTQDGTQQDTCDVGRNFYVVESYMA